MTPPLRPLPTHAIVSACAIAFGSFTTCVATAAEKSANAANAADRPNVILLMGDDHGWAEVGYNGHPILKTPVLDEMARTGLRLDRFYSAHPSCSPTRGSVITGRHPNRYGTLAPGWSIRPSEIGLPSLLAKAGYVSGHFGKWHLGPVKKVSPTNPGAMGFDVWVSHDNFFEVDPVLSRQGAEPEKFEGESSEIVVDETIRFIDVARRNEQPFLAVVWFGSPHEPYIGMPDDLALYDDLPAEFAEKTVRLTSVKTGKPTERPLNEVLRERFAEITAMDRAIGRLRAHLTKHGLRENTLVWYCGDNGIPRSGRVLTPFRAEKGSVYEGGIRVPGVIEWPARLPQPRTSAVSTVTSDMLPTLCELVGVEAPARPLDGLSLVPLLDGKMTARPEPIGFWQYDTGREQRRGLKPVLPAELQEGTTPLVKMLGGRFTRNFQNLHHPTIGEEDYRGARALLGERFKLVVDARRGSGVELFDVRADPNETKNVAADHPDVTRAMQRQLRAWQDSVLKSLTGADSE